MKKKSPLPPGGPALGAVIFLLFCLGLYFFGSWSLSSSGEGIELTAPTAPAIVHSRAPDTYMWVPLSKAASFGFTNTDQPVQFTKIQTSKLFGGGPDRDKPKVDEASAELLMYHISTTTGFAGYLKDKDQVYFYGINSTPHFILMSGTDPTSFSVVRGICQETCNYSKDKDNVYHWSSAVSHADPDTFVTVKNNEFVDAKDALYVYYGGAILYDPGIYLDSPGTLLRNVDTATLRSVKDTDSDYSEYIKDIHQVYFHITYTGSWTRSNAYRVAADADPNSFLAIGGYYGKDARHVYYRGLVVEGADVETFKAERGECGPDCSYSGKDKNRLYLTDHPVNPRQ